jgi:hypothetical protein
MLFGLLIALVVCPALSFAAIPTLINGTPVTPGTWQEVVSITSNEGGCTATIVGPRAIVTAAHCASTGSMVQFSYKGKNYEAKIFRSPRYPAADHDISVGVLEKDIAGATPMVIGGKATLQSELTILGYGCTTPAGTGGNDGILRIGKNVLTGFSLPYDIVSRKPSGGALCMGDSGGPTFIQENSKYLLLAINSKGNIRDTNYCSRLDIPESIEHLKNIASQNHITICGINSECGATPPPPAPSCTLTANPDSVKVNGSLSLVLASQNAASADIDGTAVNVPMGEKRITPTNTGMFTATATVRNSAGQSTCSASYNVVNGPPPPPHPTCTLTAVPNQARVGETISLELAATGEVTLASIDENPVSFPIGKLNITRQSKGDYSAEGFVQGPGGSERCFAEYSVEEGTEPPPIAEFAVTPTYCGPNKYPQSGVKSACLAVLKRDNSWTQMAQTTVVLVVHTDESQEVLPLLAFKTLPAADGATVTADSMALYTGGLAKGKTFPLLETKPAQLKRTIAGSLPQRLDGRSSKGSYFLVDALEPFSVGEHLAKVRLR